MQLPFLILLLMLAINAGYGALVKIKADSAARFAGTAYAGAIDEGKTGGQALTRASDWVSEHYSKRMTIKIPESEKDEQGIFDDLEQFLADYIGRAEIEMTVPRDKALGQKVSDGWPPELEMKPWDSSKLKVTFVVASNSWTYHQIPMSFHKLALAPFSALSDLSGPLGAIGGAFEWIVNGILQLFGLAP